MKPRTSGPRPKAGVPCPACGRVLPDSCFGPDRPADSSFLCPDCGAAWSRTRLSRRCTFLQSPRHRCRAAAAFVCFTAAGPACFCAAHAWEGWRRVPLVAPPRPGGGPRPNRRRHNAAWVRRRKLPERMGRDE